MKFSSATQLKAWIANMSKSSHVASNTLLQNYMMERMLERISLSSYRDHIILKGGFLIAAMIGIDKRSTMDMDTTLKGLPVGKTEVEHMFLEIIEIDANDNVSFEIQSIKPIHDVGAYKDFRISLKATLHTIKVNLKIDLTTGDIIIPKEIEYSYKLLFEDRVISVMAYNLNTILAEKIETILSRNISNTRGRDFYDVYALFATNSMGIAKNELRHAIEKKADSRNTRHFIEAHKKHLQDISNSPDIAGIWKAYSSKYPYAKNIVLTDILNLIQEVFESEGSKHI